MAHISVTKIFEFEASHHLPKYHGDCSRVHGHSYKLEVTLTNFKHGKTGTIDVDSGMIMDFKAVKRIVQEHIIDYVDHSNLNDFYENPTAEIMVADFYSKLSRVLPSEIMIESIKLWETSSSYASIS